MQLDLVAPRMSNSSIEITQLENVDPRQGSVKDGFRQHAASYSFQIRIGLSIHHFQTR